MDNQTTQTECCPKFDPAPWDGKVFEWNNKKFVKEKVFTLFYMPINFGTVMRRVFDRLKKSGAKMSEGLFLSDHTSMWNMDLYVAVDKDIPDTETATISGKFLSKVYEGNFKETGKWCKDFEGFAKSKTATVTKTYMWYTTCPKCAKKYGKNYVVIIGKTE